MRFAAFASQAIAFFKGVDFMEMDEGGKLRLAQERLVKMEREIKNINKAEQYVLIAREDGFFTCHSCLGTTTIFLLKGQVWRYGTTTKGEKGRYKSTLENLNLVFRRQFKGTLPECLLEEKKKIYFYALLPENVERVQPLIRPPGNKQDR